MEVHRVGGSSGLTRYDRDWTNMISLDSLFPRRTKQIKLVRHETTWEGIYISPYTPKSLEMLDEHNKNNPELIRQYSKKERWNAKNAGQASIDDEHPFMPVAFTYSPPVKGGKFQMPTETAMEFDFLIEFTELKLKAARMLLFLFQRGVTKEKVCPVACRNEIDHFTLAAARFEAGVLQSQQEHDLSDRDHVLIALMQMNTFTLVQHPVGQHVDTFANGDEFLENKRTFVNPQQTGRRYGRGGNRHEFTWALLDWASEPTGIRRAMYLQMGEDDNVCITDQFWQNWLQQDDLNNLARFVHRYPETRGADIIPPDLRMFSQEIGPPENDV